VAQGPKDSTLKLAFAKMAHTMSSGSAKSNDIYEVVVKRHVAIREWDETHSWLELRDGVCLRVHAWCFCRGAPRLFVQTLFAQEDSEKEHNTKLCD